MDDLVADMNSRQRRQDRRLWKYSVVIGPVPYIPNEKYFQQWDWLAEYKGKNIRTCGWRCRIEFDDEIGLYLMIWQFLNEKDAILFALKWS